MKIQKKHVEKDPTKNAWQNDMKWEGLKQLIIKKSQAFVSMEREGQVRDDNNNNSSCSNNNNNAPGKAAQCRQKVCSSKRPPKLKLEPRSVRANEVFENPACRISPESQRTGQGRSVREKSVRANDPMQKNKMKGAFSLNNPLVGTARPPEPPCSQSLAVKELRIMARGICRGLFVKLLAPAFLEIEGHTLFWHEIITKIIPWELFFVIFEGFCALEMSRQERHFQGITREIRNFPKIMISEKNS